LAGPKPWIKEGTKRLQLECPVSLQLVSDLPHPTLGSGHEFDISKNAHVIKFRNYLEKSELLHELCHAKLYEMGFKLKGVNFEPIGFTSVGPPRERLGREAEPFEPLQNALHLWWISRGFISEFYADMLMFEVFPQDSKKVARELIDWISEPRSVLEEWKRDMLATIRSFAADTSLLLRRGYSVGEATNRTLRIFFKEGAGEEVYGYVLLAMGTVQGLPWPLPERLPAVFIQQRLNEMKVLFNAVPEKLGGVVVIDSAEPCGDNVVTLKWSPKPDLQRRSGKELE
jgi:hypothetical protein